MNIFEFDSDQVKNYLQYDLELFSKAKKSLDYVFEKFDSLGHSLALESLENIDFNKITPYETKNYKWFTVSYKDFHFFFRQFGSHFTVYCRIGKGKDPYWGVGKQYGCFMVESDFDKIPDEKADYYYDDRFLDLKKSFRNLVEVIEKRGLGWFWNSVVIKFEDHVNVLDVYENTRIFSYDRFFFAMEELSRIQRDLFAENEMLEKLKTMGDRIGTEFDNNNIISKIKTKVANGYYHSVGIELKDKNTKELKFQDVYSLTTFYFEKIFNNETH